MKEQPKFIGRKYQKDEQMGLRDTLQKWSQESLHSIEGELEKTKEEIQMIETANTLIKSEMESIGIQTYNPTPLKKIHILPENIFNKEFPNFKGKAFFSSTKDAIYINRDKVVTQAHMFSTLLHELIHRASTKKFYTDKDGGFYDARVGYRLRSPWKKDPKRENRLRGFNELMTDYTVYKILLTNQELLQNSIGITKENIEGPIYTYMHYGPILESIIKKISKGKNLSHQEVFNNLERGQFKNNILALKDVEKFFGKGSLEILSLLETLRENEDNDTLEKMIKGFFSEEDESKRQNIHFEILAFVNKLKNYF
jgi:hypothetical protein